MRIRNAYVVYVDFDGDIDSTAECHCIFAGKDALNEVKQLVRQAFKDLYAHYQKKGYDAYCDIDGSGVSMKTVIDNDDALEDYINWGNSCFGNWTIEVDKFD